MKFKRNIPALLFLVSAITILAGCGKRGALIYPDLDIPQAPSPVEARTVGDAVRLSMILPEQTSQNGSNGKISSLLIYRQENPLSQGLCSSCSLKIPLYSTQYLDVLKNAQRNGNSLVVLDTNIQPEQRYTYKVALSRGNGVTGYQSEPVSVTTTQPLSAPKITVESTPTESIITVIPPSPPFGTFAGFSIYRRISEEQRSLLPYRQLSGAETTTTDFMMKQGVTYLYSARSQVKLEGGEVIESQISEEVEGKRSKDY